MSNLNNLYRPLTFNEVLGQKVVIKILQKQLETNTYSNCYLFSGPSGCGKTTLARIFANEINHNQGKPIEIDGASNNGVDNVRSIIDSATERSLDSEYKVFIIDEAHMITTQGWNAFLKCIEEPPKYTIFIFCTTDPQKLPKTIPNRCQVFNLNRVSLFDITNRLETICSSSGYQYTRDALEIISNSSNGNFRQAITYLDKCKDYGDITAENVNEVLNIVGYKDLFKFVNSMVDKDNNIMTLIEDISNKVDLYYFTNELLNFIIELTKFCIFKDTRPTKLPEYLLEDAKYATGIFPVQEENISYFKELTNKIIDIKLSMNKSSYESEAIFKAKILNLIR